MKASYYILNTFEEVSVFKDYNDLFAWSTNFTTNQNFV